MSEANAAVGSEAVASVAGRCIADAANGSEKSVFCYRPVHTFFLVRRVSSAAKNTLLNFFHQKSLIFVVPKQSFEHPQGFFKTCFERAVNQRFACFHKGLKPKTN